MTVLQVTTIQEFSKSMNYFSEYLLNDVWDSKGQNFVFSPFSIFSALAVLTSGTSKNSNSQNELLTLFGTIGNIDGLEKRFQRLTQDYKKSEIQKILSFGNGFWVRKDLFPEILPMFKDKIHNFYDADINVLDTFQPEKAVNNYVKEKTKGKITKIVDEIDPESPLAIVNALFFKASWAEEFFELSQEEFFLTENGQKISTKMMQRPGSIHNYLIEDFESSLLRRHKMTVLGMLLCPDASML